MVKMKNLLLLTIILSLQSKVLAEINSCDYDPKNTKVSIQATLQEFLKDPNNVTLDQNLGTLSLGIDQSYMNHGVSKIRIRKTHYNIRNMFGPESETLTYVSSQNSNCSTFDVSLEKKEGYNFGAAGSIEAGLARSALVDLGTDVDFVPENSHSGSHRLEIFNPKFCSDRETASINILRSQQDPAGIMRKVYSLLIDVKTLVVIERRSFSGSKLRDSCK